MSYLFQVINPPYRVVWNCVYQQFRVYSNGKCIKIGYKYDDIVQYIGEVPR